MKTKLFGAFAALALLTAKSGARATMVGRFINLVLIAVASMVILGAASANATSYGLIFSGDSSISTYCCAYGVPNAGHGQILVIRIDSTTNFTPITLFDGDTLNIQFLNVPTTPHPPGYDIGYFYTSLYAQGSGATIAETGFGPSSVMQDFYYASPSKYYSRTVDGSYFSPTWSITFNVLSGEPLGSAGVSISGIDAYVDNMPLPAALPLFATGLGALGLLGWRRKRKNVPAIAPAGSVSRHYQPA